MCANLWDGTLATKVRGVWLYLYLVIDVWSRKVVAWDVAEREDPAIAADLVSRACLRERISRGRRQPLSAPLLELERWSPQRLRDEALPRLDPERAYVLEAVPA